MRRVAFLATHRSLLTLIKWTFRSTLTNCRRGFVRATRIWSDNAALLCGDQDAT